MGWSRWRSSDLSGVEPLSNHEIEARRILAQLDRGLILGRGVAILGDLIAGKLDDEGAAVRLSLDVLRDVAANDRVATMVGNDRACRLAVGREPLWIRDVGRDDPVTLWQCVSLVREDR